MPLIMDIMNQNAWGAVELMEEILPEVEHKPQLLTSLNFFDPKPSRSSVIAIAVKDGALTLIPTSAKGEAPEELVPNGSKLHFFETLRLAKGSTVYASEMAEVLTLPGAQQTREVVSEISTRYGEIMDDMDLTMEHLLLGAVQGRLLDADGTTVLYDWFAEFGVAEAAEINFALGTAGTNVRKKCRDVKRAMMKAAKGVWTPGTRVVALCGDTFFDDLLNHSSIKETKLNTERAASLEGIEGYSSIEIEGITFINYRGADAGSDADGKIAIGSDNARFFPVGARGAFQMGYGPAVEFKEFIGQRGQPHYPMIFDDKDRGAWDRVELYSYPLPICTRPAMLQRARGR